MLQVPLYQNYRSMYNEEHQCIFIFLKEKLLVEKRNGKKCISAWKSFHEKRINEKRRSPTQIILSN